MSEDLLARLIEEYHERHARGLRPVPEDFREAAGGVYGEFVQHLEQEEAFDRAFGGDDLDRLPRMFGEYTLVELLGRGGYGDVYRAVQRSLSRSVALKVMRGGWADDSEAMGRFTRGAKAAAQVEHDHVVRIYDHGVFDGRPFLAMSLLAGPTLAKVYRGLREAGPPPFGPAHHAVLDAAGVPGAGSDTVTLARRLAALCAGPARALDAYHRRGIFHRDVKPANLLMHEKRLVLADFDLVKRLDDSFKTATGSALGTPHYMSPEQWNPASEQLDGRADVYGLGAVIYEGFTGKRPYEEYEVARLVSRVVLDVPEHPRHLAPDLPPGAGRVVMKALEKRPSDRYATGADLAADLDRLATGEPVAARPVPLHRRAVRWGVRHRGNLLILAAGLALFAGWFFTRPGVLHVSAFPPDAEVLLGGEPAGMASDFERELRAGRYEVLLRRDGFLEAVETVDLPAGGSRHIRGVLPIDPSKRDVALAVLSAHLGSPEAGRVPITRDVPQAASGVVPILPRGDVRLRDLDHWSAEAGSILDVRLVFRRGGETLHESPYVLERSEFDGAVPAEVRAALKVGDRCAWGFVGPDGKGPVVAFRVVADLDESAFADIATHVHVDDEDFHAYFAIPVLAAHGLHTAALRDARRLARKWGRPRLYAAAWRAVEKLALEDTRLAEDVRGSWR